MFGTFFLMADFFYVYTIALDLVATILKCFVLPLKIQ